MGISELVVFFFCANYFLNASLVIREGKVPEYFCEKEKLSDSERKMADGILEDVLQEGWSDREKICAIYQYVRSGYSYSGVENTVENWHVAAEHMVRYKEGDCYDFYAVSRLLLTCAGIRNKERKHESGMGGKHYWNMVLCEGKWKTFDVLSRKKSEWER